MNTKTPGHSAGFPVFPTVPTVFPNSVPVFPPLGGNRNTRATNQVADNRKRANMTITITQTKAWSFVCPVCLWPGVAQTAEAARWLAEYHVRDVHPGERVEVKG